MFANHGGLGNCSRVEPIYGAGDFAMPAFAVLGYDYWRTRKPEGTTQLPRQKADETVRLARVTARAQQVFAGQPAYAAAWLREPKSSFGDRTPLQLLATESGALVVEEQLIGIEHGMFG